MKHILVINRWAGPTVDYESWLDHRSHRISYLASGRRLAALAPLRERFGAAVREVDTDNVDEVIAAARDIERQVGTIDGVVALAEMDLLPAARVRECLGIPGDRLEDLIAVRDKRVMKRRMRAAGARVAAFTSCEDAASLEDFVRRHGFPLVVKPARGYGGYWVQVLSSQAELQAALADVERRDWMCETYVNGQLYHADGLVEAGRVSLCRAWRYVNTPLAYNRAEPLGGYVVDSPRLAGLVLELAQTAADALGVTSVFHLEFFETDDGDLVFSEIAARTGGGPINELFRDLYGVDLLASHAAAQAGVEPPHRRLVEEAHYLIAGYLCFPEPHERPARVTRVADVAGGISEIYKARVPEVGTIFDSSASHLDVAGEFLYRGSTTRQVRAAIDRTLEKFTVEWESAPLATATDATPTLEEALRGRLERRVDVFEDPRP